MRGCGSDVIHWRPSPAAIFNLFGVVTGPIRPNRKNVQLERGGLSPTEIFQLFGWSRHLAAKQEKCTAKGVGFTRKLIRDVNPPLAKGRFHAPRSVQIFMAFGLEPIVDDKGEILHR